MNHRTHKSDAVWLYAIGIAFSRAPGERTFAKADLLILEELSYTCIIVEITTITTWCIG
jgi:hypothetical protein